MNTAKETVRQVLDRLSDNATYEDIMYHIYVQQKVALGRDDIAQNRLISQEEMEQRMAKWIIE